MLSLLLLLAQDDAALRLAWGVPRHLDPHRASTSAEARYVGALFEGLTTAEADGVTPAPGVAETWEVSPDGLTWVFRLREASWSNGDPLTARDFVFAWRRAVRIGTGCPFLDLFRRFRAVEAWLGAQEADAILDQYDELKPGQPELVSERLRLTARARHAEALKRRGEEAAEKAAARRPDVSERDLGFEAVDDRTLRVTLERRTPWLPHLVSLHAFVPLHEKSLEANGEDWVKADRIVTNGPYLFAEASAVRLLLRRNPKYWDPALAAAPERVECGLHTPDVALEKFREGRLDWIAREQIPDAEARTLKGRTRFDGWGVVFLRLHTRRAPFDRPGFRAAFAKGVDRAALAEAADASPATGLVPPGYPGWTGAKAAAFDPAGAVEGLLKESDFDLSKLPELELLAPDVLDLGATAEGLKTRLEKTLALKVSLRVMKLPAYLKAAAAGEFHLALGAWLGDAFDPSTFLEGWTSGSPLNAGRWESAAFDERLKVAAACADPAERLGHLKDAEAIALGADAAIPLFLVSEVHGFSPRLNGVQPNPLGRFPLKRLRVTK
ncbi:MAG TPA: peptide ABC transporter substrate-binding protein [Planctomycetota bacterium]